MSSNQASTSDFGSADGRSSVGAVEPVDVVGLGQTHIGRRRPNNEDTFVVNPDLGLFLVCDGMGGHAGGEVAAALAAAAIERVVVDRGDVITRVAHDPTLAEELVAILTGAVSQACREIHTRATSDPALAGMGCTATALLVAGSKAVMAHVGDTRLYLSRAGEVHQLSSDHTLPGEMVRQGTLAPENLPGHPQSNVLTRALGPQALVEVESLSFDVAPGDTLVLCSDGLGDYIPSPMWLEEQVAETPIEDLPDVLINFANANGGKDNTTVIIVSVSGTTEVDRLPRRSPQLALDILGSSFLFSKLTLAQLSHVLNRCEVRTYEAGDVLCNLGDIHDELLIIVSGTLRVSTPDGRATLVGPGQHLGESLVLRPRPARARISSVERSNILALKGLSLIDLASRRPWLGVELLSRLAERLSGDVERLCLDDDQATDVFSTDLL